MKFRYAKNKADLIAYDNSAIAVQDERGRIAAAENKGKVEGQMLEKRETILRGHAAGVPLAVLAQLTGLTEAEVAQTVCA